MTIATLQEAEEICLTVERNPEGQVDSVVPVRWGITPALRERIAQSQIARPFLLLVVTNGQQEMARYVEPLTSEMRYIQFTRPGLNTIWATVVWVVASHNDGQPNKVLLERKDDRYVKSVVVHRQRRRREVSLDLSHVKALLDNDELCPDERSTLIEDRDRLQQMLWDLDDEQEVAVLDTKFSDVSRLKVEATLDIEVPENMFAESKPWTVWLGNLYDGLWSRKAKDQCSLRRRAMFTAPTLPFYGMIYLAALLIKLTVVCFLLFFGKREINYDPLRRPMSDSVSQIWRFGLGPSLWTHKKTAEMEFEERPFIVTLFAPPSLALFAGAGYGLSQIMPGLWGLLAPFGVVIVLTIVGEVILGMWNYFFPKPFRKEKKKLRAQEEERKKEEAREAARLAMLRELDALSCTQQPRDASFSALPAHRRTVGLWMQRTKAQVCRPFAD